MNVEDIALKMGVSLHGRYNVQEVYYMGHTSIVYMGYDAVLKKRVVIKEYCPYKLANRDMDGVSIICKSNSLQKAYHEAYRAFEQEVEIVQKVSGLKEPYENCTLKYLDAFYENQTMYLITELVEGISLEECIQKGIVYSIRSCMLDLVRIVTQIHNMGILHRDIKPSNIIIRPDGRIVLIDYGSACYKDGEKTQLQFVSRGYSAPELYTGGRSGFQTDTYSIGALLYYILTDYQLPAPNEMDEDDEIPNVGEIHPVPKKLERIVMRSIDRNPRKRTRQLKKLEAMLMI